MPYHSASLLPAGLYDLLPPRAAHERHVNSQLVEAFERFGYAQVSPALMEFEATLLSGRGASLSAQTYRVMDALSQQMMGFRPDITLQVGRIAAMRMAEAPRPLRLAYSGSTLRVKGEGKERARQWRQAGIEMIGTQNPQADAEVIAVAAHSVAALGVAELVVDINFPGLVKTLLQEAEIPPARHEAILHAVECKDSGWIKQAGLSGCAALLHRLMDAAGDAEGGMMQLQKLDLPASAREQVDYVQAVIACLRQLNAPVELTIDPVENKGFEYHSLISFSLFSRANQMELGRGGRYFIPTHDETEEPATGVTLYVNTLMDAVPLRDEVKRVLVGAELTLAECAALQQQGFVTLRAMKGEISDRAAQEAGCRYIYANGAIRPVGKNQ